MSSTLCPSHVSHTPSTLANASSSRSLVSSRSKGDDVSVTPSSWENYGPELAFLPTVVTNRREAGGEGGGGGGGGRGAPLEAGDAEVGKAWAAWCRAALEFALTFLALLRH